MNEHETISLKEFFEEKFRGVEQALRSQGEHTNLRFDSLDKALSLAREDAKTKYEHLNALRFEVTTDRGLLVAREGCKRQHDEISIWKGLIDRKLTILETRSITWTAAVGIFFVIISIVMRYFGK